MLAWHFSKKGHTQSLQLKPFTFALSLLASVDNLTRSPLFSGDKFGKIKTKSFSFTFPTNK